MQPKIENRPNVAHCELCGHEIVRFEEYATDGYGNNIFKSSYRCKHCATIYEEVKQQEEAVNDLG